MLSFDQSQFYFKDFICPQQKKENLVQNVDRLTLKESASSHMAVKSKMTQMTVEPTTTQMTMNRAIFLSPRRKGSTGTNVRCILGTGHFIHADGWSGSSLQRQHI